MSPATFRSLIARASFLPVKAASQMRLGRDCTGPLEKPKQGVVPSGFITAGCWGGSLLQGTLKAHYQAGAVLPRSAIVAVYTLAPTAKEGTHWACRLGVSRWYRGPFPSHIGKHFLSHMCELSSAASNDQKLLKFQLASPRLSSTSRLHKFAASASSTVAVPFRRKLRRCRSPASLRALTGMPSAEPLSCARDTDHC
ncbi:hypothetical protein EK21DRAFT_90053 [Setomelanomma holmii]|uniref:Uncharacterized protein n=1 Tax=Setomelanomma holmii TaxID=210430 RepID=A0A9P4H6Q8_9PLEO|nr:hypothetical protein EK21DRAFT_90053 [Setomelanomma holmii]